MSSIDSASSSPAPRAERNADSTHTRLTAWADRLSEQLSDLLERRQIFLELQDLVATNAEILRPPVFYVWLTNNYVEAMCVGLRRLIDGNRRTCSLKKLLEELLRRRQSFDRTWYRAEGARRNQNAADTDYSFDLLAGEGQATMAARIRVDLDRLERASATIKDLVDQRIAHTQADGDLGEPPTFRDIDVAIETIDETLGIYYTLLKHAGLNSSYAHTIQDWRVVVTKPWIEGPHHSWPARRPGYSHDNAIS